MAQAAVRLEAQAPDGAEIVPFAPASPKPALVLVPPSQDVGGFVALIGRAASQLATQKQRADTLEARAAEAERLLTVASRALSDTQIKLDTALDEAKADKQRAADAQRRAGELIEKTRIMMIEAAERLRAAEDRATKAEARAEKAEGSFTTVRLAVEKQFAPLFV